MSVGRPRAARYRLLRPGLGIAVLALAVVALAAAVPAPATSSAGLVAPATSGPTQLWTSSPPSAAPAAESTPVGLAGGDPTPDPTVASGTGSQLPCPSPPAAPASAPVLTHGPRAQKVIALTFDDGWGATTTEQILAILERSRVNATFFPVGLAIEQLPDTWRKVARAGFPIGDHTYDHRDLIKMCYDAQQADLAGQSTVVSSLLGVIELPVMRPPYGAFDAATRVAAAVAGQRIVLWDVDTHDWSDPSPATIASRALAGTNGSIVVMHTFVPNTVLALPRIIAGYRARGFRFVTIGQLLGIAGPVPFSPRSLAGPS